MQHLNLSLLGIAGLGPPLVYSVSQQALYVDWKKRTFWAMPMLFVIGTGIAWTNSRAVCAASSTCATSFCARRSSRKSCSGNIYALHLNTSTFWELALCFYAAWGTWTAYRLAPALMVYLIIYCIAFGVVALWGVRDA